MTLSADVLAKLLIMQSMINNMPDETSVYSFLCRGLNDVPGTSRVWHSYDNEISASREVEEFPLKIANQNYGAILIKLSDTDQFSPYRPYIHNLCFMVSVILDGRRLKALTEENKRELVNRVRERTMELSQQIEERKAAEQHVMEQKERLNVTLRSIGDGVITTDTDGRVVIMNGVAEMLTGWLQDDAQGRHLDDVFQIVNENTRERCPSPAHKVMKTGDIVELSSHTLLIAKDGSERVIADSAAPILDGTKMLIGIVLVFRDINEKQKMLEHLRQSDKLEALGLLAGGIAHDFNNLLAGIFGFIDIARTRMEEGSDLRNYLDQATSVFHRAKDLTQQLLTFSKGGTPICKPTPIEKLLNRSVTFALSGSNVAHSITVSEGLWLCDIDENQIGQVIDNLCINALQAMPLGGKLTVHAQNTKLENHPVLKSGNYVEISLSDTGIGIKQQHLQKIFDPFFTTKQRGNGLGLATCYSIIQKHEGLIEVKSVLGQGTTFTIYLSATDIPNTQITERQSEPPVHRGGTVLIMDDEDFIRELVVNMLELMGYSGIAAQTGEQAIEICKTIHAEHGPLKAVILDLTIPGGMGGKEAVTEIRTFYPDIPIFASSGYSEDPVMATPTQFGFTDSIPKPYRHDDLSKILAAYLNN